MQFGHLHDVTGIDFRLPPDHPLTAAFLTGRQHSEPLRIYIGVSRWNIPAWQGVCYPKGTKDALPTYASLLNGIELNTTHYRIPDHQLIRKWQAAVSGRDFLFSPKFPQVVSHRGSLSAQGQWTTLFVDAMAGLEQHLGHSFLQLPPAFGSGRVAELIRFVEDMPSGFPYGIELRHGDWISHQEAFTRLMEAMHRKQVIPVFSDTAGRRDLLHMCLTAPTVMIRWLGNNGHPTDKERLQDWVDRIAGWQQQGLSRVYWFIHQHDDHQLQPTIALLQQMLQARFGITQPILPAASGQGSLF